MFAHKQSLEATTSSFFIVVHNHMMCNYAPGRYCIRGGDLCSSPHAVGWRFMTGKYYVYLKNSITVVGSSGYSYSQLC